MPKAMAVTMMVMELSGTPENPCTATTNPTGMVLAANANSAKPIERHKMASNIPIMPTVHIALLRWLSTICRSAF